MRTCPRPLLSRRSALSLAAAASLRPRPAAAQHAAGEAGPPTVVSNPPRAWGADAPPEIYPDPDIIVLDPAFNDMLVGITAIRRVWTGGMWVEGPAWSSEGQYLVFSDVQADVQYRYLWETGEVTPFRRPSYNSNGNSFDFQGRQPSTEDYFRRVVRWEHDGTMTVLAENFEGKPLNSPNDIVPHPDGSVWFTDPAYGDSLSEGHADFPGGPANPDGLLDPRRGGENSKRIGGQRRALPGNVYRIDPGGRIDMVISGDQLPDPNGICFSPDHRTLYVCSTAKAPGDTGAGGRGIIYAFDVQGTKLSGQRVFSEMMADGVHGSPDGFRCDVAGNLWCGANAGTLGYDGVWVLGPSGKLRCRIRLPQLCSNVAFGGPKRNFLFIACGQSLFRLMVQTQGAAPG